jgi:type I restriction-modification system DNA methylase subunit
MEDRDTKGDLYEYMLGKIATAGQYEGETLIDRRARMETEEG